MTAPPCAATPADAGLTDTSALPFDRSLYLDDFHQLIAELSSHYANLESAKEERHLDLPRLKREAESDLRAAKTRADAQGAIDRFLRAFGDGHLWMEWEPRERGPESPKSGAAGSLCERLGYGPQRSNGPGIDFALAGGFHPIDDEDSADVPGGVLDLPSGAKLGIVRIAHFSEKAHPGLCATTVRRLAFPNDAPCDDDCRERIASEVSDAMTASLERRLRSLRRGGSSAIVVDITGNGGGDDWVEPAVRVMTPVALKAGPIGFLRHPHWVKELQDSLRDIESDLPRASDADRRVLLAAEQSLQAAVAEAEKPCDTSSLWEDGATPPACTLLVHWPPLVLYARPGTFAGLKSAGALFGAAQYRYHEGVNTLPVIVLVDGGTASASEFFAATLVDHHTAVVIGQPTVGAGCGYTNGGIETVLVRSRARVHVPDCVRLRADGSNEYNGVTPDLLLPFGQSDSPYQRAMRVKAALPAAYKLAGALGHR